MLLVIMCISCKKVTIDFTYSPAQPKAGEKVTFLNVSSVGEEWLWHFGDRDVSSVKSPTHTYTTPGTYQVELKVDNKDSYTCTHMITVVDTVPTYTCDHDSLSIVEFEDVLSKIEADKKAVLPAFRGSVRRGGMVRRLSGPPQAAEAEDSRDRQSGGTRKALQCLSKRHNPHFPHRQLGTYRRTDVLFIRQGRSGVQ